MCGVFRRSARHTKDLEVVDRIAELRIGFARNFSLAPPLVGGVEDLRVRVEAVGHGKQVVAAAGKRGVGGGRASPCIFLLCVSLS